MSPDAGYQKALEHSLDLVCVSPNATIPVCKMMNYGQYKFSQIKREKEAKKKMKEQKGRDTSEVQLNITTQKHDLETKKSIISRLILKKNNNVRIVLRLRGRERDMVDLGIDKINELISMCSEFSSIKTPVSIDGNDISVVLEYLKV